MDSTAAEKGVDFRVKLVTEAREFIAQHWRFLNEWENEFISNNRTIPAGKLSTNRYNKYKDIVDSIKKKLKEKELGTG